MKLGVFFELPVPGPWTPGKEEAVIRNCVDRAVVAEQAGFHSVWTACGLLPAR